MKYNMFDEYKVRNENGKNRALAWHYMLAVTLIIVTASLALIPISMLLS